LTSTDEKKKPVYWDDTVTRIKSINQTFKKKTKALEEKKNLKNAGRKKSVELKPEKRSVEKVLKILYFFDF
jgi:hypothetical protein